MTPSPVEQHLVSAERRLVESMRLRPITLPERLSQARGLWKDAPVTITTRAYEGDAVALLRVALVSGVQLCIGNLLVQPRPNRPLPILAADLVWNDARREALIAVDLSSVNGGALRDADHRLVAGALPDVSSLPQAGDLPAWYRDWFSPSALYTRVGPERLAEALVAFDAFVGAWITLAGASLPQPEAADAIRAQHQAYASARRADDRGRALLGTMFGRAWADEYVKTVLFPGD